MPGFHIPEFPDQLRRIPRPPVPSRRLSQFIFQPGFLPIGEAIPVAIADAQRTQPVCVRITARQISKLRDVARGQMGTRGEATNISRENAITGFIIAAINAYHPTPIRQIGHTLNVSCGGFAILDREYLCHSSAAWNGKSSTIRW